MIIKDEHCLGTVNTQVCLVSKLETPLQHNHRSIKISFFCCYLLINIWHYSARFDIVFEVVCKQSKKVTCGVASFAD